MKKLSGFLLRLGIVVAIAVALADRPGSAHIVWHDYDIQTSAAMLALGGVLIGFLFYMAFRLLRLFSHGPIYWRLRRRLKKIRRGHDNLADALIAIAGGDAAEAGRHVIAARKNLGGTMLSHLLQAQAAQMAGDDASAHEIFVRLAREDESAVLGYRGLIMLARKQGNWAEVERLGERLYKLQPNLPWLGLIQFDLLVQRHRWVEAHTILNKAVVARLLPPELVKQHRAALWVATSQDIAANDQNDLALQLAEKAARQRPDWAPAIINLARQQMKSGHARAARRTIEKYWAISPHVQLAALYRADKTGPLNVYKNIEKLCRNHLEDGVSLMALAEAAVDADLWGEARRHLMKLITRGAATQAVYRLLARLEKRERSDDNASLQWLAKAADAAADPAWLCNDCGGSHPDWRAACTYCNSFNTLQWRKSGAKAARNRRGLAANPELAQIEWQDVMLP